MVFKLSAKVVPKDMTGDLSYPAFTLAGGADVAEAGKHSLSNILFLTGAAAVLCRILISRTAFTVQLCFSNNLLLIAKNYIPVLNSQGRETVQLSAVKDSNSVLKS